MSKLVAKLRDPNHWSSDDSLAAADLVESQAKELAEARARVLMLEVALSFIGTTAELALKTNSRDLTDWRGDVADIENTVSKALATTGPAAQTLREKHYEECAVICDELERAWVIPEVGSDDDIDYLRGIERGFSTCADKIRTAIGEKP